MVANCIHRGNKQHVALVGELGGHRGAWCAQEWVSSEAVQCSKLMLLCCLKPWNICCISRVDAMWPLFCAIVRLGTPSTDAPLALHYETAGVNVNMGVQDWCVGSDC